MGKKRGVKSWYEAPEKRRKEIFEAYSRQYDKKESKGFRLAAKMDFYSFESAYGTYYDKYNKKNVVRHIINDQVEVTEDQSKKWSKMVKDLAKRDERFKGFKNMSALSFKKVGKSEDFWALVGSLGGFKKVMYVDGDD